MSELKTYAVHFCGVGGACYGIEQAGLECKLAIDWFDQAVEFREKNLGHKALRMDISTYQPDPSHAADLLWTSPSCQSFSTSARDRIVQAQKMGQKDIRDNLFLASVEYCKLFRPKYFVLENVTGMLTRSLDNDSALHKIREMFEQYAGYHTEWNVLCSINWNLPQKRDRVIIVGSRDGKKGLIPVEPFMHPTARFGDVMEHRRVDLCWGGKTYKTALSKVQRTGVEIRVVGPDDVLPTITCGWGGGATRKKVAILDATADEVPFLRHPSILEGARSQGFPDHWQYPSSSTDAWTLIGNAVPSPMAKTIVEHLKAVEAGMSPPCKTEVVSSRVRNDLKELQNSMPRKLPADLFE